MNQPKDEQIESVEVEQINASQKPKKAKKKMSKTGKVILFTCLSLVGVFVLYFIFTIIYHAAYVVNVDETITNNSGYVVAQGKGLYDKNGNHLVLQGTNAGNWLIVEGYLGVTSVGNFSEQDGKIVYDELSQSQLIAGLDSNVNLTETDADIILLRQMLSANPTKYWWYEPTCSTTDLMLEWYYSNWWGEVDFANVKALGMNCIRLPFYYRTLMEGDDNNLTMRANAFKWLDWFVGKCAENELYCIIDCHGAVGSQNGYEHSGVVGDALFWDNERYIEQTCYMWQEIARHYLKDENVELGKWIAAYDLLNEPCGNTTFFDWTDKKEWDILDRLYDAVRQVDTVHCISIGACWSLANSPNPKTYNWENVLYQQHWYNWLHSWLPNSIFYMFQDFTLPFTGYDVPTIIGEFNNFDEREDWEYALDLYAKRNYSWTTWNYKAATVGWWDTSWGLYTIKMNSDEQTDCKINVATASAADIIKAWGSVSTNNCGFNQDWFTIKGLSVENDKLPYTCAPTNEEGYEKTYDFIDKYLNGD